MAPLQSGIGTVISTFLFLVHFSMISSHKWYSETELGASTNSNGEKREREATNGDLAGAMLPLSGTNRAEILPICSKGGCLVSPLEV